MKWFVVFMMHFPYYGGDTPFQMFPVESKDLCDKQGAAWVQQMSGGSQGIPKYKCIQLPTE